MYYNPMNHLEPTFITLVKTADKGTIADHKVFTGYTIEGYMLYPPDIGNPFRILRTKRNGVSCPGLFTTSTVEEIAIHADHTSFSTKNSEYRLTVTEEPNDES